MKRLVLVRAQAEHDLTTARDWYARQRGGLGNQFLDAIAAALREIQRNPELVRPYFINFRRVHLRRFPYKIFYQIIGDRVMVFRVLHSRRDHGPELK